MVKYLWRELELISMTTISNIISFIQFGILPLDFANSESDAQDENSIDKIEKFITLNFKSVSKLLTAPFDLIRSYNSIAAPVRASLTATIAFAGISLCYKIFFMPSWHIIMFLMDLFFPASFLFGIIFIARNYEEQKKIAISLICLGIIYFILRIIFILLPVFKRQNWKWYIKCAKRITDVFASRIKGDKSDEELASYNKVTLKQIDMHEYNIQFDNLHFPMKRRIFDLMITMVIWLLFLILILIGWEKILKDKLEGQNLKDLVLCLKIVTYILFGGVSLRVLFNIAWLFRPIEKTIFNVFYKVKSLGYKGVIFLMNLTILPILTMVLSASATTFKKCGWYQYYDFRSNANSFLQYFMARKNIGCVNCSKYSANFIEPCNSVCYYDPNVYPLTYKVLIDSGHISETELTDVYLIPTILLEIFYLSIFYQIFRQIYCIIYDVLTNLPGPTKNVECKFQTLLFGLESAGVAGFKSYRYKSALYNFTFTQSKLFVCFLTSLLTVIPIKILKDNNQRITPWIYFFTDAIISSAQIYSSPYISILHNIVNFVSYIVAGITSLLVGLHVCQIITISPLLGNFLFVLIVITPIITALVTPFFAKRDKFLVPTQFDLLKIICWDEKLNKHLRRKMLKKNNEMLAQLNNRHESSDDEDDDDDDNYRQNEDVLDQEESSVSISYFNKKKNKENDDREHNNLVNHFNTIKLAPIEVQEGINVCISNDENMKELDTDPDIDSFKNTAKEIWPKINLLEEDFDLAVSEMLSSSNRLIDTIAYNSIMRLINLTIVFSSACLGWSLSSGIVQWNRVLGPDGDQYYMRCNMFNNGTYPAFGEY